MKRSLGLMPVVAVSMGAMLGSGIFVLPGIAASMAGPSVPIAYLIAAICVLPAALSKAELATAMPTSGGTYVYISRAFGPVSGTIAGLGLWLSLLFKSAFALVGLSAYLKVLAPHIDMQFASIGILVGVTVLNVVGVRAVSRIQMFVVASALLFLLFLCGYGAGQVQGERFDILMPHGPMGMFEAAAFVSVSFAGVTKVAAIAEEVRDPGRNLPLGMLVSLGMVGLIYVGVVFVLVGIVPLSELANDSKENAIPMVHLSKYILGATGGMIAAILGVLTMTSMANSGLLASSRFPFAMSRDELLPKVFQRIHPRLLTPYICILVTGSAMAFAILYLDVIGLAKLASALKIFFFIVVNAAIMVFRKKKPDWYKPEFHAPFFPYVQIFGIVVGIFLISRLGMIAVTAVLGISVAGIALYFLYALPRIKAREALRQSGRESVIIDLVEKPPIVEEVQLHKASSLTLLLGREHTPEKLVEIGAALADGGQQEVVHIIEVPEQTDLDALHDDRPEFEALQRRVQRVAKEWNLEVELDGLVSHDIDVSVPNIIKDVGCSWAVIDWSGPAHHNFMQSEKHWSILDHAPSNLALYKDDGVQEIRKILVYAEPDLYDQMVVQTGNSLAKLFNAELTFVRCVEEGLDPVLELAQVDYIDQLRTMCDVEASGLIVYGKDPLQSVQSITKDYDLLLMATNRPRPFANFMRMTPKDHLTEDANCSVLRLKPRDQIAKQQPFDPDEDAQLKLSDVLDGEMIQTGLNGFTKETLFRHIAEDFSSKVALSADLLEAAFWDHEKEHNTGIGLGAALPHATVEGLEHETMGIFILDTAIEFDATDGMKCDVFVVVLSSPVERHTHLVLQNQLSDFVRKAELVSKLRACHSQAEVVDVFRYIGEEIAVS